MPEPPTERDMLINLVTETKCLGCGGAKRPRQSFCGQCYQSLPTSLKPRLYRRVGEGYEEAFRESLDLLLGRPPMPDDRNPPPPTGGAPDVPPDLSQERTIEKAILRAIEGVADEELLAIELDITDAVVAIGRLRDLAVSLRRERGK